MEYKKTSFFQIYKWLLAFITIYIAVSSCHSSTDTALDNPSIAEGQRLALKHCGNCHTTVLPDALDKETWGNHVLPAMAPMLGLEAYEGGYYYAGQRATVSYDEWQKIVAYYVTLAPLKLKPVSTSLLSDWTIFSLEKPLSDTTNTAETTLVAIDTIDHKLYSSDGLRNDLTSWDQNLRPIFNSKLKSPAVNASFFRDDKGGEHRVFTCLGTMAAADISKGELIDLYVSNKGHTDSSLIYKNLPRPLQSIATDINKDGLTDWIVCGFGHLTGGLYWLKQEANRQFTKLPIREVAGAIQATTGDFNADGWPDIMVLFAHADEGIWLFLNDKAGGFIKRKILQFSPVQGSTSFQLVDFNKDGQLDILYTCGDNSDYSKILKPYHGLYIYLNMGNFQYRRAYFHHIDGCIKAIATDFDRDGDLDIASIAFFADFQNNPTEGFLYFKQEKSLQFIPYKLPVSAYGRWICMDVGDWDQDGDSDIILGNFSKGFINQTNLKPQWNMHIPFIVLKNKTLK